MNIRKLPSGSYQVRQNVDGVTYSATFKHRPSPVEAMKAITKQTSKVSKHRDMTVVDACEAYLDAKSNILSPSTIRGYKGEIRAISDEFGKVYINSVTGPMLQKEVNDYAEGRKPKTVSNYAHFLTAVLNFHEVDVKPPVLPMKVKTKKYFPTEEEVQAILQEVAGTKYEVFFRLAVYGLRRSEIAALTLSDLSDDNVITINKAMVTDGNNKNVIKSTKTTESTGTIKIDDELAELIRSQGFVWDGYISKPYEHLQRVQDKLGIQRFPLHTFRHFMASYLHNMGVSEKQIMAIGRWKTPHVMKSVYEHEMEMDKAKQKVADIFGTKFGTKNQKAINE